MKLEKIHGMQTSTARRIALATAVLHMFFVHDAIAQETKLLTADQVYPQTLPEVKKFAQDKKRLGELGSYIKRIVRQMLKEAKSNNAAIVEFRETVPVAIPYNTRGAMLTDRIVLTGKSFNGNVGQEPHIKICRSYSAKNNQGKKCKKISVNDNLKEQGVKALLYYATHVCMQANQRIASNQKKIVEPYKKELDKRRKDPAWAEELKRKDVLESTYWYILKTYYRPFHISKLSFAINVFPKNPEKSNLIISCLADDKVLLQIMGDGTFGSPLLAPRGWSANRLQVPLSRLLKIDK